ncbi:MAG: c-type cytochrome [Sphingomicrobium sp.]
MRFWGLPLICAALAGCNSAHEPQQAAAPPPVTFEGAQVTHAAAKVAHGERIASVLGCRGCHTATLQGQRFYELYASNLTREIPKYSDSQLERLLRHGEHPSGRTVWGMPSEIFQHLDDTDLATLTAYLRTMKPAGPPTGKPLPFERDTKKLVAEGKIMPAAQSVARDRNIGPPDLGETHSLGRYITRVTCAECHGPALKGNPGDTPDLIAVGGYSRADFEQLLTKGVLPGGRKFKNPLMGEVAKSRFTHLTPHERDAVYVYLKARAERSQ